MSHTFARSDGRWTSSFRACIYPFCCALLIGNLSTVSWAEDVTSAPAVVADDSDSLVDIEDLTRPDIDWSKADKKVICSTMVSYGTPWGPTGSWNVWNSGQSKPNRIIDEKTERRDLQMLHYPMIGVYDNKAIETIHFQMDMADRMGIDAWAIWYWPPLDGASQIHHENMKLYMDFIEENGRDVKVCGVIDVAFFPLMGEFNRDDVVRHIEDFLKSFANRPSYFCYQDRPVVYFFPPTSFEFTASDWRYVLRKCRSDGFDPICFIEIGFDWYDYLVSAKQAPKSISTAADNSDAYVPEFKEFMDIFDGVFNMTHIGFGHLKGIDRCEAWKDAMDIARTKNCLFMPNPAAGYRTYLWVKPPDPVFEVPRNSGEHYNACWRDAIDIDARWIFLHTWNEWFEHTQLEPALEYGYQYVDLTRKWTDALRR